MAIGSGVLLPGVAENPTFPILSALAYTTAQPVNTVYSMTTADSFLEAKLVISSFKHTLKSTQKTVLKHLR